MVHTTLFCIVVRRMIVSRIRLFQELPDRVESFLRVL